MQTFPVPVGVGPNRILTPFPERTTPLSPRIRRGNLANFSTQRPFLGLTRFGLGQVPVPDPDSAVIMLKGMFGRVEGLLYTIADAAVSSSPDMAVETTTTTTKQNSDWLSGITNAMETVLKILKDGLSAVHVPYSYGFAIILLTVIVKTATFPLTKKQVESTIAMRSLAPQIKAIQERYAGDQERIQLETARLYKLAGINPLAGCLPTLATIPIWIGLYRALSNVADEGLLTEGFFWIPSLAGPTTVAARQTGGGTSWLFHFVDGHPPLGWSDTLAYLVLPVLLVVSQYISVQIMQPQQSNDPNLKSSQAITKFLPLVIGYFALSVPSGLSLYWFTNNILSTAQQIWLQKLGGAQNPVKKLNYDNVKKEQLQVQKSLLGETPTKDVTKEGEKLTPEGLGPGDRFKQIKEQEARRRKQREEEKRKAEEAAAQNIQTGRGKLEKEDDLVESEDRHQSNGAALDNSSSNTRGLFSSETVVANGSSSSIELKQDMKSTINRLKESEIADNSSAENNQQTCGAVEKEVTTHSLVGTQTESASKDLKADSRE